MIMNDEAYAYFFIEGFLCKPDDISKVIKLKPTEYRVKGEISKLGFPIKQNCWILYSTCQENEQFLDNHIKSLLDILLSREKFILKMTEKYECGINCVGVYVSPNHGIHLSKEIIKGLSRLNIELDFDLYCNAIMSSQ